MNQTLKEAIDALVPLARDNLERDGQLLPVAFIFAKDFKGGDIIGCPWSNDEDKERTVALLQKRCREMDAFAIAILNEAWEAAVPGGKWDGTPASKMPGRKEVVMFYVEELDGCWRGIADIVRTRGKPTFGELKWEPMGERAECERFQKFLA